MLINGKSELLTEDHLFIYSIKSCYLEGESNRPLLQ